MEDTDKIIDDILIERNSRKKKVMRAFTRGRTNHIKCFGILTAENPMGREASREENRRYNTKLKNEMRVGHFPYLSVKGYYGGAPENSFLIYNVSFKDIEQLAGLYRQESFIFGRITGEDERGVVLEGEYWERSGPRKPFKLIKKVDHYIKVEPDLDNPNETEQFFTQICRAFRFRLPFFEEESVKTEFSEDEEEWLAHSIDDNTYAGGHRYRCRCKLYGMNEN